MMAQSMKVTRKVDFGISVNADAGGPIVDDNDTVVDQSINARVTSHAARV